MRAVIEREFCWIASYRTNVWTRERKRNRSKLEPHNIVLCGCECGSWFCVPTFSGVSLLILFFDFISGCVCCVLYLVFRLISSRCFSLSIFFFVRLFNGYLVALWLVFMHFTKQAENCSAYGANHANAGSTDFTFGERSQLCKYLQCARFVSTERISQRTRIFVCVLYPVEWTAAVFITKCNAIDNRRFACLHLAWLLFKLFLLPFSKYPHSFHSHKVYTQTRTHKYIQLITHYRSKVSKLTHKRFSTKKKRKPKNDTICSISILLSLSVHTFRIALLDTF